MKQDNLLLFLDEQEMRPELCNPCRAEEGGYRGRRDRLQEDRVVTWVELPEESPVLARDLCLGVLARRKIQTPGVGYEMYSLWVADPIRCI